MNPIFQGLEGFLAVEPIAKGWSGDKKYKVTAGDGTNYLLRISPGLADTQRCKALFAMLEQAAQLDISMNLPVEYGVCDEGVYSLYSWIEGADLEAAMPLLSETEQYVLGLKSGRLIRQIHTIPAPSAQEEWASRFNRKTDNKIRRYLECGLRIEGGEAILDYLEHNRKWLENRPQCFQHGDYHVGNMMVENGELSIIDFDRYDFGDPWEEFNRIVWSAAASPWFATGQLRGYFGGEPPLEFFQLLAFYIASNTVSSVYWAIPFGPAEVEHMLKMAQDVLHWFDQMKNPVPVWYLKDFYIQYTDGVPYKLKAPFDFSFLKEYGRVFKVFDDQDSGNICFGMVDEGHRSFVKFAGAPTARACVSAGEAIANLKRTVPVYRDLAHPALISLIEAKETGGGFAMQFEWVDAECMHPMYPRSRKRFMQMTMAMKHRVFDEILAFHTHAARQGYVAVDFYDGSVMYDFGNHKTIICDIDFYAKTLYINEMGRLWGSSRFMSPEEFCLGAVIDEITNVYAMGAMAFALFGDENDRCLEKWTAGKALFDVAARAVSDERDQRQQSIEQLTAQWRAAR